MFGWIRRLFAERYPEYCPAEVEKERPFRPTGDIDAWNYGEYLRILPLFEAVCRDYEADPAVTFVRLYAPDPSKGAVSDCLRGIHLITASKKDCRGNSTDGLEFVSLLRKVTGARICISASIAEVKGICVNRFSIEGTGMERSPLYNGTFRHPPAGDYHAIDIYDDRRFFPDEVFDMVELHPELQPREREDLWKFDNRQFEGKTKYRFYSDCDYRGRANGQLADFFITTDRVSDKPDENEMWYFLRKIGDGSRLANSGRAHMRMSDDGESVVVDLTLDGSCIVDARDRILRDGELTDEECAKEYEESCARWRRQQERERGAHDICGRDCDGSTTEKGGQPPVMKTFKVRHDDKTGKRKIVSGNETGVDGSGRVMTMTYDASWCLDAVAGRLGRSQLEMCREVVDRVLGGGKTVVEIIGDKDSDPLHRVSFALANELYSRCTEDVPSVCPYETTGCYGGLCEDFVADEKAWLERVDRVLNKDLVILNTPAWCTKAKNEDESGDFSGSRVSGYGKFSGLLRSRLEAEGNVRQFVTLDCRRWRIPWPRWITGRENS